MLARGIIEVLVAALVAEVLFCRWLARKWKPASTAITIAAGIAALVIPACAVLPYTNISLPLDDLVFAWLVVGMGVVGIGIGVFAFSTGSKIAGAICVATNIPVVGYWGFVSAFFSMGGSR